MKFSRKNRNWKTLYLEGLCSYAKVYDPDEFRGVENWKINLYPDDASMVKFKNSGLQLKKKDDTGETSGVSGVFYSFRRPVEKEYSTGKIFFTPPVIYDLDGEPIMQYTLDGKPCFQFEDEDADVKRDGKQVLIGNGSRVQIGLFMYNTDRFGWGHRLNSVKILDLIEYDPDTKSEASDPDDESDDNEDQPEIETKAETPKTKSSKVKW